MDNFSSLLLPIDKPSCEKVNREISELDDIFDQMDSTDIYRTLHPNTREYTLFSAAHEALSNIGHI